MANNRKYNITSMYDVRKNFSLQTWLLIIIISIFRAGNAGFAYTLISIDQERCAGDLIRALETSNELVPEALRTMWLRYQAKQAAVSVKMIFYLLVIKNLRFIKIFNFTKPI